MTSVFKKWSKGLCCNALSGDALPPAFLIYNITKIVLRLSTVGRAIEAHRPFAGVTNSPETVCCGLLCVFQMIMIRCAEHHGPYGEKNYGSLQTQANKVSSNGYEIDSYPYVKDSLLHGRHLCYNADNRYGHMKECEL